MSLTPVRPLKRAGETPVTEQRRPTFQTPGRTPRTGSQQQPSRFRSQTPALNSPRVSIARGLKASTNHRELGISGLRREYSVDRSVALVHSDQHDYLEEEEFRDFQQDTIHDSLKGLPAGTILARDTFHQVAVHGSVPDAVREAMHDVDFADDDTRAVVDSFTGFAAVSTPQQVSVWNYAKVRSCGSFV
jgi:hypothetical protein